MKKIRLETITIVCAITASLLYNSIFVVLYVRYPQRLLSKFKNNSFYQEVSYTPKFSNSLTLADDIDEIPPLIYLPITTFETSDSEVILDITSRESLKTGEFSNFAITEKKNSDDSERYAYQISISALEVGENERTISFIDQSDNKTSRNVTITRTQIIAYTNPIDNSTSKVWADGDDLLAVVDKEYSLYSTYAPSDLVYLSDYGISATYSGMQIRSIVIENLKKMVEDAAVFGHQLKALSAYRSYAMQVSTYNYWVSAVGQVQADRASARPAHSEHQLGTTIDFTSSDVGYKLSGNFGYTPSGKWLAENVHTYGFVLSYPEGSESVTGYKYEPWHFRYVGIEQATKIYENGYIPISYLRVLQLGE